LASVLLLALPALMQVASGPRIVDAASTCSWVGTWDTVKDGQAFILDLRETSLRIEFSILGNLGPDGAFVHAAAPSATSLLGRWYDAFGSNVGVSNEFTLTLARDCESFTGEWVRYSIGTTRGPWTGRRITADPARTAMVVEAYRSNLCRDPDTGGRAYWTVSGIDSAGLEAELRRTNEWKPLAPVYAAYMNVLGRNPMAGGGSPPRNCEALFKMVSSGLSQADIEAQLAASREGLRVRAVRDLYIELLGRDPLPDDRAGLRTWVNTGLSIDRIRERLTASDEYRQRHPDR